MQRRTYVATVGAALAGGCLGLGGRDGQGTDGGTGTPTGTDGSGEDRPVGFEQQWQTDLGIDRINMARVSTAVRNDTVYTTHDRGVTALSLVDGDERWAKPTPTPFDALTADEDGVFAVWTTGELLAVDPDTGDVRWERGESGNESAIYGPVVTTDEHVAASGPAGTVVYEKATGQRVATLGASASLLAAHDGGFLVDSSAGLARYAPGGTVDWRADDVPVTFALDASVTGTTLIVAGDTSVGAIDLQDGARRWAESIDADLLDADVTTAGGVAFVSGGLEANTVYAVEVESGKRRWTDTLDGTVPFPMVALDSALIVEDSEQAQARDHRTGEVLDSFESGFEKGIMGTAGRGRTFVGVGRTVYGYRV